MEPKKRSFTDWRIGLIGVFAFTVILYLPSLMGAPIWDDSGLISGEQFGGNTISSALTHSFGNYFRPLTSLSFVLDTLYAKGNPFFYHQTNIVFHALTAVLVCCLAFVVTGKKLAGIFAGLFFATQPLQLGAAAWIGGRTDVLSSFFLVVFLVSLVLYHRSSKTGWVVISTLAFFLAALSKEQSIAVLPAVPLSVFVFGSKKWKDAWRLLIPFGTATLVFFALWARVVAFPHPAHNGLFDTVTLALRTAAFYGLGFLVPNRPSLVTFTLENFAGFIWIAFGALLVGGFAYLLRLAWRKDRAIAWVAICGLLVYIPISNFPTLPSMVIASYRFAEAGTAAACLLGIICAFAFSSKRYFLAGVLAANLLVGAIVTWWGSHLWMTSQGFFSRVSKTDPHFIDGIQFYAHDLEALGKRPEAEQMTEKTIGWIFGTNNWADLIEQQKSKSISPEVMKRLSTNIGVPNLNTTGEFIGSDAFLLARLNQLPKARLVAADALIVAPHSPWLNFLYGRLIHNIDRKAAIHYWEIAVKLAPGYADCAASLAHERVLDGRYADAVSLLSKALDTVGYKGGAWLDMADAKIGLHDFVGATVALDKAMHAMFAASPSDIETRNWKIQALKRNAGSSNR